VADDQDREHISWESLAASEVAKLRFPGSTLVEETHHNEGEGWGFDNSQLDAMLLRQWAADAEPDDVMGWFREAVTARGWTAGESHPFEPGNMGFSSFSRENSHLMLRVFGTGESKAWWTYWRKSWNDGRLYYDVTLTASSSHE
jgi:hypothetical protein